MLMLDEQSSNGNNYVPSFPPHSMFFSHASTPHHSGGPERLKLQSYRTSPYNYSQHQRKSSPTDGKMSVHFPWRAKSICSPVRLNIARISSKKKPHTRRLMCYSGSMTLRCSVLALAFQTKVDPYPSSSTSPFDPSMFYTPTTPASMPCSSSSPLSPNTAAAAAYYSNSYYPSPASYYFPYGTTPSPASHHPFMAPLSCPLNNGGSSPLSPSFLHLQQPVAIASNMNNHSASSSPKEHENLFDGPTAAAAAAAAAAADVRQY